jgi:mannose-1-phosphate guanylyltransferase/mannose-6-phosphate isomerase
MSRRRRPKQFLALAGDKSLFQQTAMRVSSAEFASPIIIGGKDHAELIEDQLAEIGANARAVILEPFPRNTAPVAAVAAALTQELEPGALALLMPSDHFVADDAGFRRAVAAGAVAAHSGRIVTLGIRPVEPHTGFGYIERGDAIAASVYEVRRFHEKPALDVARQYLVGGAHFWNAGIFLFASNTMRAEFERCSPAIWSAATAALAGARVSGLRRELDAALFAACPSDSIDFAVMEKTERAAVVAPVDVGWSDIGSWAAIAAGAEDDRIVALDVEDCLLKTDGPFIGAVGVRGLVVVASGDAVLVTTRDRVQDVKKIVDALKDRSRDDLL